MKEYHIEVRFNGVYRGTVDGMRSNVESASFMKNIAQVLSSQCPEDTIIAILYCNSHALSAFDWENGECCGQISLESIGL